MDSTDKMANFKQRFKQRKSLRRRSCRCAAKKWPVAGEISARSAMKKSR